MSWLFLHIFSCRLSLVFLAYGCISFISSVLASNKLTNRHMKPVTSIPSSLTAPHHHQHQTSDKQRPKPRWCNWLPLTTLTAGIPCQQLRKLSRPHPPHLQTANEGRGSTGGGGEQWGEKVDEERQKHRSVFISTSDIKELNYMPRRIPIDVMLIFLWIGSEGRYLVSLHYGCKAAAAAAVFQAAGGSVAWVLVILFLRLLLP